MVLSAHANAILLTKIQGKNSLTTLSQGVVVEKSLKKIYNIYMETKICISCKDNLPTISFSKDKTRKDGMNNKCRACDKIRAKKYSKNNPKKIAKANKKSYSKNRKKRLIYYKKWYSENKKRKLAHYAVKVAISNLILFKKSCEVCGEKTTQAHHSDYNKPLEVIWLCVKCHSQWHSVNQPIL
jgi:ribosomal protein S27AE